jgi:hypothetical protein
VLKRRRGPNAPLNLAELRAGRCASSDAIPDAAGGEDSHGAQEGVCRTRGAGTVNSTSLPCHGTASVTQVVHVLPVFE